MKTLAIPALLIVAVTAGGLGACERPTDREDLEGLPRDTVPLSVPPLPGDPRPPPESTVPPRSPGDDEPPGGTPPLPGGRAGERPAADFRAQQDPQDGYRV